ncbi:MAG: hypothetical protein ACLUIQ_02615 [Dialister invisus]
MGILRIVCLLVFLCRHLGMHRRQDGRPGLTPSDIFLFKTVENGSG